MERALCPVLIGREDELSALEDGLLSANRGEGQVVLLAGDAGMGKTRLATELTRRARRMGMAVLVGGCSEADLALPFLPFLEAIGNFLAGADLEQVRARLGPVRRELAHLFPQLEPEGTVTDAGDQTQGKLRLFEAMLALLTLPAADQGLVIVIEDLHWADASTRELLDYLTRRLRNARILVLGTYRRDEMHRKHQLLPLIQGWRRSAAATIVELEPLTPEKVAQMVTAIFDLKEGVQDDTRDFLHARTEGNPFVLEEMLKAALDRGDIFRTDDGWTRKALGDFRLPESVRDTILLRLDRLSEQQVEALRAASVLGYAFDYSTLAEVAGLEPEMVQEAVETCVQQQLLVDVAALPGRYRFRHALTREAIYEDMIVPRRERLHVAAAEALARREDAPAIELCNHLLAAGRKEEAVPLALRAATDAELAYAYPDAAALYEKILSQVKDEQELAGILCRLGRAHQLTGDAGRAASYLEEGIALLEKLGDERRAAGHRVDYGRCLWESGQPDAARREYERARDILEPYGPSAELATAYVRLAGLHVFAFDSQGAAQLAERAIAVAEAAGADAPRIWAYAFLGSAYAGLKRGEEGIALLDRSFEEALAKGYFLIAENSLMNGCIMRMGAVRALEIPARLQLYRRLPPTPNFELNALMLESMIAHLLGEFERALKAADRALELAELIGGLVFKRRLLVWSALDLIELGQAAAAERRLGLAGTPAEAQELAATSDAEVRLALLRGDVPAAVSKAAALLDLAGAWAPAPRESALEFSSRAFLAAADADGMRRVREIWARDPPDLENQYGHNVAARLALSAGEHERAAEFASTTKSFLLRAGYWTNGTAAALLLAEALAASGDEEGARRELAEVAAESDRRGAVAMRMRATRVASRLGFTLESAEASAEAAGAPAPGPVGERLVTVLFADVRGYTAMSRSQAPAEMVDRIATFQRWAAAEIVKQQGAVDKFAGDAVMATFNISGAHLDHARHALVCALALRDKAAVLELPLGIGIATGAAVVGVLAPGANVSVVGETTNLASRLQGQAEAGEVVISTEAHRRVAGWLAEQPYEVVSEALTLKGFETPVTAWRVRSRAVV